MQKLKWTDSLFLNKQSYKLKTSKFTKNIQNLATTRIFLHTIKYRKWNSIHCHSSVKPNLTFMKFRYRCQFYLDTFPHTAGNSDSSSVFSYFNDVLLISGKNCKRRKGRQIIFFSITQKYLKLYISKGLGNKRDESKMQKLMILFIFFYINRRKCWFHAKFWLLNFDFW